MNMKEFSKMRNNNKKRMVINYSCFVQEVLPVHTTATRGVPKESNQGSESRHLVNVKPFSTRPSRKYINYIALFVNLLKLLIPPENFFAS